MSSPSGLDSVQSFLVVAEELNFRRSAERLNVDQSALTRRIQKLENSLGFKLFERTTREVSLTPAGQSFYKDNAYLLTRYSESIAGARRIADGKVGHLRLAYMAFAATELMPMTVARFRNAHPHIDVALKYIRTQGQKLALANDEIDLGYMIGPFQHTDYYSLPMSAEPLYVVTPRNHALLRKSSITPFDIAGEDLILGDMNEWVEYRRRLSDLFSAIGVDLNVTVEASNTLALLGLVAAGIGITIYPESLIGFLGGSVEARPINDGQFRSHTVLVWRKTNRSKQLQAFVEIAKNLPARS